MVCLVEVFFDDLVGVKQKELLRAYKVDSPSDLNWDIVPIAIIEVEE